MDESTIYGDSKNPLLSLTGQSSSGVSPLEQEVLDEYERLLKNMNEVKALPPSHRLSTNLKTRVPCHSLSIVTNTICRSYHQLWQCSQVDRLR